MVGSTAILGLTTFVNADTVDLVTHVSTGVAQRVENVFTGAASPAGSVTLGFGSVTANQGFRITETFNSGGVTFTAAQVNVTDTASAAASKLLDLQTGGSTQWNVTKAGAVTQQGSLTVVAGGVTITAGGLTVTAGGIIVTGGVTLNNAALTLQNGTAGAPTLVWVNSATTGLFAPATNVVGVSTAGTERVRVDASGNVGVGVTPSAWGGAIRAVQVGATGAVWDNGSNVTLVTENTFSDGTNNKALVTAAASRMLLQTANGITFDTAPSVAAGANQTFTTAMQIANAGFVQLTPTMTGQTSALNVAGTMTNTGGSTEMYGTNCNTTMTAAATATNLICLLAGSSAVTVNAAVTVSRVASVYINAPAPTVTGTLTNNNAFYMTQPSGGTTVRVIDSASGGFLTTAGIWTNNPSWARYKSNIRYVPRADVARLYDWFTEGWRPARYRHDGTPLDADREDTPTPIHQDYEYDSFFALLDDMPEEVREVICADPQGGVSTKDTDGLLFALLQEAARRIAALEARPN